MNNPIEWVEQVRVCANDVDFEGKWKPTSMLQAMQEVGTIHANHLGVGYTELTQYHMAWVLSRSKVRFIDFPAIDETVTIHTWPRGIQQKIFFDRHFKIVNASGKNIALASSAYLLIDTQARRMLLPSALNKELPLNSEFKALEEPLEKITMPSGMVECMVAHASYGTIDLMGHVNNTRYMEWVTDCFPLNHYRTHKLEWVQINYANEVKPDEVVSVSKVQKTNDEAVWFVQGTNLTAKNRAFESALAWSKR